jgi:hypothetical protein
LSQSKLALLLVPAAAVGAGTLIALRLHFEPPTVPPYTLAESGDCVVLAPGHRFEVDLRPTAPVTGAVGARAFLLQGEHVRPWDPPFSVFSDGSVRIAGSVDALFAGVPAGDWEIAVAVGRPEVLPTAPRDVLRARSEDGRHSGAAVGWRLVRERVRLGD